MTSFEDFSTSFILDVSRKDDSDSSDSELDFKLPAFNLSAFQKYNGSASAADKNKRSTAKSSTNFYVNVHPDVDVKDRIEHQKETLKPTLKEAQKKMVVKAGFETLKQVPTFLSRRQSKKIGMKEKEKTKGPNWYNMPAPELTEEIQNDLTVVKMRKALDPKHFYKRSAFNTKSNPKYFEVGTYEESPLDFYSSRVPKKQRKGTLVEELMADSEFRSYQKKKMAQALRSQPPKKFHKKSKKTKDKKTKVSNSVQKQKKKKKV